MGTLQPDGTNVTPWIRLDRHELVGAFGDLGTSLPPPTAPYGFGVALAAGTILHALLQRRKCDV
jgi:hypothetical protein